jgi:hypothetical protein
MRNDISHSDCQELFPEALYGELAPEKRTDLDAHLASCTECTALFEQMRATVHTMSKRPPVEAPVVANEVFWSALEERLEHGDTPKNVFAFHVKPVVLWSYGIAAVLLIGLGVVLGKFYFSKGAESQASSVAANIAAPRAGVPRDSIDILAADYLERSKMLLTSVINDGDEGTAGGEDGEIMDSQKKLSRELLTQAAFLEANLTGPDQQRVKRLVGDLQVILMELANVGNQQGVPLVEIVKSGVDKGSILLKINIEQMRALGAPASGPKPHKASAQSHL